MDKLGFARLPIPLPAFENFENVQNCFIFSMTEFHSDPRIYYQAEALYTLHFPGFEL